jgi:hypothetical protein
MRVNDVQNFANLTRMKKLTEPYVSQLSHFYFLWDKSLLYWETWLNFNQATSHLVTFENNHMWQFPLTCKLIKAVKLLEASSNIQISNIKLNIFIYHSIFHTPTSWSLSSYFLFSPLLFVLDYSHFNSII